MAKILRNAPLSLTDKGLLSSPQANIQGLSGNTISVSHKTHQNRAGDANPTAWEHATAAQTGAFMF